ncbi:MAG TPA: lysophospholipid acyltransferase family protein [Longimicrobiales bacterium]|nr:lysophospholipid acyltransferase family protein [Longimicrobiales bacterium]
MIRGWLALAFASLALVVGDIVQRLVIAPWIRIRPSSRVRVLSGWMKLVAWMVTRPVSLIGGCLIPRPPRNVPAEPGVLLLMNHQSLFDIPIVIQAVQGGYPRIVTRQRYAARYIPLVSKMVELYQYPVVDPTANAEGLRAQLERLAEAARDTDQPLVIFPEGRRTRDGQIGAFRRGALRHVLAVRPWRVYVYVTDGFWRAARYRDFARELHRVRGRVEHVATLEWTDPAADPRPFIEEIHRTMVQRLAAWRAGEPGALKPGEGRGRDQGEDQGGDPGGDPGDGPARGEIGPGTRPGAPFGAEPGAGTRSGPGPGPGPAPGNAGGPAR